LHEKSNKKNDVLDVGGFFYKILSKIKICLT